MANQEIKMVELQLAEDYLFCLAWVPHMVELKDICFIRKRKKVC